MFMAVTLCTDIFVVLLRFSYIVSQLLLVSCRESVGFSARRWGVGRVC